MKGLVLTSAYLMVVLGVLIGGATFATEDESYSLACPSFSPDGARIAFSSDHDQGRYDIYCINTDGTGLTRLTDGQGSYTEPAWSPDGALIACERSVSGASRVFLMRSDGSEGQVLGSRSYETWGPAWLSDGSALVVTTSRGGDPDLIVIDTSGGCQRYVAASNDSEDEACPSPDGQWAIYTVLESSSGLDGETLRTHIWKRSLTDITAPRVQLTYGDCIDQSAEYSPDGTRLIFVSNRGASGGLGLWVAQADGSNPSQVNVQGECRDPVWSSDGNRIAFARFAGGQWHICAANPDGTGLTQVTHQAAAPALDPPGGTYSEAQMVAIACSTPGATIRYTTDGSEPSESSALYSTAVTVDHSLALKAKAWKTDCFPSYLVGAHYIIE